MPASSSRRVRAVRILAVPTVDQIPRQVVADYGEVAELLGHPGLLRGRGDVPVDDAPGADLQEEDDVVGAQRRGRHGGEVTGPDEASVVGEERQPAQAPVLATFRREPVLLQDARHTAPAEACEAQLAHLPGNLAVAQSGVLPGDTQHQLLHLRGDSGKAGQVCAWGETSSAVARSPGASPPVSRVLRSAAPLVPSLCPTGGWRAPPRAARRGSARAPCPTGAAGSALAGGAPTPVALARRERPGRTAGRGERTASAGHTRTWLGGCRTPAEKSTPRATANRGAWLPGRLRLVLNYGFLGSTPWPCPP